jgi:hypothetical protein
MKHLFSVILLFVLVSLAGCKSEPTAADIAAQAAKQYYVSLLHGKYDQFVDGQFQPDRIPGSYREQLIANAKMFIGQQKEEHRGIRDVRIMNAKADTIHHVADIFLVFAYGDSTNEEIVVPMVEYKGVWYMK